MEKIWGPSVRSEAAEAGLEEGWGFCYNTCYLTEPGSLEIFWVDDFIFLLQHDSGADWKVWYARYFLVMCANDQIWLQLMNDNVYIVWTALGKTVRFPCVIFPVPSAEFNSWNAFTATIGSSDQLTIVSKAANTWKNIVGKRLFKVSKRISKRSLPLCYSMIPEVIRTRDSVYSPNTSSVWLQESCTTTSSKRLVTKQAIRLYNLIGLINLLSLC